MVISKIPRFARPDWEPSAPAKYDLQAGCRFAGAG